MFTKDDKIYYEATDFEQTVRRFKEMLWIGNSVLFSIYQGSLTLGHRLSKEYALPHSIIKYQRIEGNDSVPTVLHSAVDNYKDKKIILLDDIYDTGETMNVCSKYVQETFSPLSVERFVIFKNNKINGNELIRHCHESDGKWVVFLPWEGN
jgi:hypoxanthine phosphoribosyltransferase